MLFNIDFNTLGFSHEQTPIILWIGLKRPRKLRKYFALVSLLFFLSGLLFYSSILLNYCHEPFSLPRVVNLSMPPSSIPLTNERRAVRLAPQVACPWPGFDPAPSPTGPTSTLPPPALPPPPPPPRIARPSAVPPPTTGSGDTATSVSLFSNLFISLPIFHQHFQELLGFILWFLGKVLW